MPLPDQSNHGALFEFRCASGGACSDRDPHHGQRHLAVQGAEIRFLGGEAAGLSAVIRGRDGERHGIAMAHSAQLIFSHYAAAAVKCRHELGRFCSLKSFL